MQFKIIGASKATGDDVETIINVRDERAAEKWAADSGILWTSITASGVGPPPVPVSSAYSAVTDGVLWLIGTVAVLIILMLMGVPLQFDARGLGAITGTLIGGGMLVLLLGLIGALIGGKKPSGRRGGFAVGAALAVALMAIGQYRIHQRQAQDSLASSQQIVSQIRAAMPKASTLPVTDDRSAVASANSSAPPDAANLSASEAADAKVMLVEVQKFQAEANAKGREFQANLAALMGDGILQPSKLDSKEKIDRVKATLVKVRALIDQREADAVTLYDSLPGRFAALPIGQTMKDGAIAGCQANVDTAKAQMHELTETERQFVAAAGELADLMESRLGHFEVKEAKVYFADAADIAKYNAAAAKIQELVTKEQNLINQQQAQAAQAVDKLGRVFGK